MTTTTSRAARAYPTSASDPKATASSLRFITCGSVDDGKSTLIGRLLVPVTPLTPPKDGEAVETRTVRFRTVGDITCTCPVESDAATPGQIVIETLAADVSERGATRMDDKTSEASMEKRKKDGYF